METAIEELQRRHPNLDRGGGTKTFPVELDTDTSGIDLTAEDEGEKAIVPFAPKQTIVQKGEMSKSLRKLSKVHQKPIRVCQIRVCS